MARVGYFDPAVSVLGQWDPMLRLEGWFDATYLDPTAAPPSGFTVARAAQRNVILGAGNP